MADLVNEIISDVAFKQLDDAITKLGEATTAVKDLAAAGKMVTFEFKGIANLQALTDLLNSVSSKTAQFTTATQNLAAANVALNTATAQFNQTTKENADRLAQQRLELGYVTEQLKILNKDIIDGKGNIDQNNKLLGDWTRRQQELKVEISATTGTLKSQIKETNAAATSMDEMTQTLGRLRENYRTLTAIQRASPLGEQMRKDIRALDQEIKVLDASIGNNQRSVGNYQLTWANISQQLERLGVRFLLFYAVVEYATGIFKDFYDKISFNDEKSMKAAKKIADYTQALQRLGDEAVGAAAKEQTHAQILIATASNINLSYSSRIEAIEELRKSYQGIFEDYTDEEMLAGKAAAAEESLTKAIILKAQTKAYASKIELEATRAANAQNRIDEINGQLTDKNVPEDVRFARQSGFAKELVRLNKEVADSEKRISEFKAKELDVAQQYDKLVHGNSSGRTLSDIDTDIKVQERLRDTNIATSAAHTDAIAKLKLLSEERKRFLGEEDKSAQQTLKSETDLSNSIYQLEKQRVDADRDSQKEISDNVKNDLEIRLRAYQQYTADLGTLAAMERDKEISIHAAKLAEIDNQLKTATPKQAAALRTEQDAQNNFILAAMEKFNTEQNKILLNSKKDVKNIISSSNSDWIKENEDTFAQLKLDEMTGYMAEGNILRSALDNKLITRKQYDKDIKGLQQKQHIAFLQAEIEFDNRILANDRISDEERKRFKNKLINDTKALGQSKDGEGLDKPKSSIKGHITDPIANLLVPPDAFKGDLEKRQKYLDDFYKATTDLAKESAQAIIEAQNRQYENQLRQLDQEKDNIRTTAQEQEITIKATSKNKVDEQNKLSKLAAQTEAQDSAIEDRKRKIQQQQARFQREAAIAAIIANTAVAITKVIAELGVLSAPVVALIAATGAIQLAAATNAPIPQYRQGIGIGNGTHPGGAFIAGDGGERELIAPPGKSPYWSNAISTMYSEAPGTKVIPISKIARAIDPMGGYMAGSIARMEQQQQRSDNMQVLGKMFDASLARHGENLSYVIMAARMKPQPQEKLYDAVIRVENKSGL